MNKELEQERKRLCKEYQYNQFSEMMFPGYGIADLIIFSGLILYLCRYYNFLGALSLPFSTFMPLFVMLTVVFALVIAAILCSASYFRYKNIYVGVLSAINFYYKRNKWLKMQLMGAVSYEEYTKIINYDPGDPRRLMLEARIIYQREHTKSENLKNSVQKDLDEINRIINKLQYIPDCPKEIIDNFKIIQSDLSCQIEELIIIEKELTQSYESAVTPFRRKSDIINAIDSLVIGENIKNRISETNISIEKLKYTASEANALLSGISNELSCIVNARMEMVTLSQVRIADQIVEQKALFN